MVSSMFFTFVSCDFASQARSGPVPLWLKTCLSKHRNGFVLEAHSFILLSISAGWSRQYLNIDNSLRGSLTKGLQHGVYGKSAEILRASSAEISRNV